MSKPFYSKILLFGEYTLMFGSKALSIPFEKFYWQFVFNEKNRDKSVSDNVKHLVKFLEYLKNLDNEKKELIKTDTARFESDLKKGMSVESNIPVGYGLGSSGALVAAVFDKYGSASVSKPPFYDLKKLKKIFSVMESFFHGKSSGFDPLVSFLNAPVSIDENGTPKQISLHGAGENKNGTLFLLDSKTTGETRPLVEGFVYKFNNDDNFRKKITQELIPLNNRAVDSFINGNYNGFSEIFFEISLFTFNHLSPMIPETLTGVWKRGLETGSYSLKLCGSGGGGMMLGFTSDFDKTVLLLKDFTVYKVF